LTQFFGVQPYIDSTKLQNLELLQRSVRQ